MRPRSKLSACLTSGAVMVLGMHANISTVLAWEFFVLARSAHPDTWDF